MFLRNVILRPVSVDDIAAIRYVHEAALRACAAQHLAPQHLDALAAKLHCPEYIDRIVHGNLTAAWMDDEIIGTAGWLAAGSGEPVARIHMLHIWPLFKRAGVGSALLAHAEAQAYHAGYRKVRTRAEIGQVAFFRRFGYAVTSQGALRTPSGGVLPVAYLRKNQIYPLFPLSGSQPAQAASHYHH